MHMWLDIILDKNASNVNIFFADLHKKRLGNTPGKTPEGKGDRYQSGQNWGK